MKISYVNIFVSDLDRAVKFYQESFGFGLEFASAEYGYASFNAGPIRLGIAVPGPDKNDLVGRHTGVGFEVADLTAEHDRLSKLGVQFKLPPTRQPWGGFLALVADPDGNIFYLDQVSTVHG